MRSSDKTDKIGAALARVQAQLKPVERNKGVDVPGKDGARGWSSKYVTLDKLWDAAKDILTIEGVALIQGGGFVQGGGERLFTRLILDEQWVESDFPIKVSRDGAQGYGGGMSFARRWGVCCMLGLVAVGDDDERSGYQDNRPTRPQWTKTAPGLAERIAGITASVHEDELSRRVIEARSVHPLPEEATAVERATSAWFVQALGVVRDLDALTVLRDACNKIKPRGGEVREAIRVAEARLINGDA